MKDLTGKRFGRLTVLRRSDKKYTDGTRMWDCICDCGTEGAYLVRSLINGKTRSCGCLARELSSKRELIDLTGKRFGRLTVIERAEDYVKKNGKEPRWKCLCDCGKTTIVSGNELKRGGVKSCGCLVREVDDISGEKFGHLTAIRFSHKQGRQTIWECKCDCGNTVLVDRSSLISGATISCGHIKEMVSIDNIKKASEEMIIENTNLYSLFKKKPPKNNSSGFTGVCRKDEKWAAYITFQKVRYYLGSYYDINDAAAVREMAEEKLHGDFLKWYKETKPEHWERMKAKGII